MIYGFINTSETISLPSSDCAMSLVQEVYAPDGDGDPVSPAERRATRSRYFARLSSLPPPIRVQPLFLPQCWRI